MAAFNWLIVSRHFFFAASFSESVFAGACGCGCGGGCPPPEPVIAAGIPPPEPPPEPPPPEPLPLLLSSGGLFLFTSASATRTPSFPMFTAACIVSGSDRSNEPSGLYFKLSPRFDVSASRFDKSFDGMYLGLGVVELGLHIPDFSSSAASS